MHGPGTILNTARVVSWGRSIWIVLACLAVILMSATSCGSGPAEHVARRSPHQTGIEGPPVGDGSTVSGHASSSSTSAPRGPLGSGQTVRFAFAGDSSFQGLSNALARDPSAVLRSIAPVLGDADVTMVNLEAALGSGGTPEKKAFTFQAPVESLTALKAAGVDLVTMANNHGMDFGVDGLKSSLAIKASGVMPIVGIGVDSNEAYGPYVTEIKGQRLGFIAANDVFDASLEARWTATATGPGIASAKGSNQEQLITSVSSTRPKVDTLVVFLHFGRETETCPNARQKDLAQALIDAGADIVVGSHAHRIQGVGYVGDKLVSYGLGNFIFKPGSSVGRESGVLMVSATGSRIDSFEWKPAAIDGVVPVPLTGTRAAAENAKMARLQACAGVASGAPDESHKTGDS